MGTEFLAGRRRADDVIQLLVPGFTVETPLDEEYGDVLSRLRLVHRLCTSAVLLLPEHRAFALLDPSSERSVPWSKIKQLVDDEAIDDDMRMIRNQLSPQKEEANG
jgi:hypothetical protein